MNAVELLESLSLTIPAGLYHTDTNVFMGSHARRSRADVVRVISDQALLFGFDDSLDKLKAVDSTRVALYDAFSTNSRGNEQLSNDEASNRYGQIVLTRLESDRANFFTISSASSKLVFKNIAAAPATVYVAFCKKAREGGE